LDLGGRENIAQPSFPVLSKSTEASVEDGHVWILRHAKKGGDLDPMLSMLLEELPTPGPESSLDASPNF
jgi:hypothetical protein